MRPAFPGGVPRLFGHRGAAGAVPENTLPSFARACADGADVLELDVRATADGEIVVIHDATVDRTTDGAGAVCDLPMRALESLDAGYRFTPDGGATFPYRGGECRVPRLADLLADFPRIPLNVEIKQAVPSIVEPVVALLRRAGAPVVLAAEQGGIMAEIRRAAPDLPTSLSADEVAAFHGALERGETPALPAGAVALQIPPTYGDVTLVTEASVGAAHALGAEVHVWTINEADEMRRLLALGCDGIMSDLPALARAVLDERR